MTKYNWWPEKNDKEQILEFFLKFSRLEYAMKTHPDFSKKEGYFKADWYNLETHLKEKTLCLGASEALRYLKERPVEKQEGFGKWKKIRFSCDWNCAIKSIKTVRNNLFHGGKYPWDGTRDTVLIKHCLTLMDCIIQELPPDLEQAFIV